MTIYGYVEKGIGKSECQDRVLIGDSILAGGFLRVVWDFEDPEDLGNLLIAVADGVGGKPGGEKASLMAVDAIRVLNRRIHLEPEDIRGLLTGVNDRILAAGQETAGMGEMATTLTALAMNREKAVGIHIGNCRLCSHKKYLQALTQDQTTVAAMVSRGQMTQEEAKNSPLRSQIDACLGGGNPAYLQMLEVTDLSRLSSQDDNLILTCDGIHDYVSEEELEELLARRGDAFAVLKEIAGLARKNGSRDDVSIIIVDRLGRYEEIRDEIQ